MILRCLFDGEPLITFVQVDARKAKEAEGGVYGASNDVKDPVVFYTDCNCVADQKLAPNLAIFVLIAHKQVMHGFPLTEPI